MVPPSTPLRQFRAKASRQQIHPRELALLWIIGAQLVFLPWALGGMPLWSQLASLGLSVLAILCALLPRNYNESTAPGQPRFRLYTWPKLRGFPVFWLGLVLLVYIATQALNPAWIFDTDGTGWWMQATEPIRWLPSGVDVPFSRGGPWRMLIIYASVWFAVCAAWIGFTRRQSILILFTVLATNAFLLAGFGIAERGLRANKIFWLWQPPAAYFVSSFIYKNHAGAYFNLALSLCAGLAYWHYERSQRRFDKSSPAGVFAFFGTAVAMIVVFSYSRAATILLFGILLVIFAIYARRQFKNMRAENRSLYVSLSVVLALVAFVRIGTTSLNTERFVDRMSALPHEYVSDSETGRRPVAEATWGMAQDRLLSGWGAGSFRFLFPLYQQQYPQIFRSGGKRVYWEHAHNDYLELLAELGIVGLGLILAILVFAVDQIRRLHALQNPLALFIFVGLTATAMHSLIDFNFYNPAILTTWWMLVFGILRWTELEERKMSA